jgi:hypothetical protein
MKLELTKDELYAERVSLLEGMLLHSAVEKNLIKRLLTKTFPSEPQNILSYRESVFLPITKTYFDKIIFTLNRVINTPEFNLITEPVKIKEWVNEKLSNGQSLLNFIYSDGVKHVLQDANGLFLILPFEVWRAIDEITNGYTGKCLIDVKFFNSYSIYYNREYILLKYGEGFILVMDGGVYVSGGDENFSLVFEIPEEHNVVVPSTGNFYSHRLKESFISGVCPYWTQALIEFSDKQGALKHHLYPEKWRIESGVCNSCSGAGVISHVKPDGSSETHVCTSCGGNGHSPSGVYAELVITKDVLSGDVKPPFVGYVEKDINALEFVSKDIQQNIASGLAAINMEFLLESPLNQSGVAKELDKSDATHFIKTFSKLYLNEVGVGILKAFVYYAELFNANNGKESLLFYKEINENGLLESRSRNYEIYFTIPERIDFVSNRYEDAYLKIISSNTSTSLKREAEKLLLKKSNSNNAKLTELCIELDELYGYTFEQKVKMLELGAINKKQFEISVRINYFVCLAIHEYGKGFYKKDYLTKLNLLYKLYEGSL